MEDNAPSSACVLNEKMEVTFADSENGNKFRIVGYSGGIIKNHWYWGNLAIDLTGVKFFKNRIPVLEEHFKSSRIGFYNQTRDQRQSNCRGRIPG